MRYEAHERNRVATNALPETFVDHAEEIWGLYDNGNGKPYPEIAKEMQWGLSKVKNHAALCNINIGTWRLVVSEISKTVTINNDSAETATVTPVTENLLRYIFPLQPDHQHELVSDLIAGEITKSKFKALAGASDTCRAVLYRSAQNCAGFQ